MGTSALLATYTQKYPAHDERRKGLITFSILLTIFTSIVLSALYFLFKEDIISYYQEQDRQYMDAYYAWLPALVFVWGR